jgi:hypothetical protein
MTDKHVWASGDRYTKSYTRYEKTHKSGMVERVGIEEVRLLHPRLEQLQAREFGPRVISRKTTLYNTRTHKAIKPRTAYWTATQSGHGGKGAEGDKLGGFWTGGFQTYYLRSSVNASIKDLVAAGFKVTFTS